MRLLLEPLDYNGECIYCDEPALDIDQHAATCPWRIALEQIANRSRQTSPPPAAPPKPQRPPQPPQPAMERYFKPSGDFILMQADEGSDQYGRSISMANRQPTLALALEAAQAYRQCRPKRLYWIAKRYQSATLSNYERKRALREKKAQQAL